MRTKEEVDKMVEENIELVGFVINKYFKQGADVHSYIRDDIYQEGSIGLFKAAQTYDETKGIRFSTYASRAISNCISRYFKRYVYKHYRTDVSSINSCVHENYGDGSELTVSDVIEIEEAGYEEIAIRSAVSESGKSIIEIEKIVELRLQGYLQKEIGKKLNVSQVQISRRLSALENILKAC